MTQDAEEGQRSLPVDNDGRSLFAYASRWPAEVRKQQKIEAIYIVSLLGLALLAIAVLGLASTEQLSDSCTTLLGLCCGKSVKYGLLAAGGVLGGTVYGAKWLYHAVARGLWHEDRRLWRFMQPWISLGTTVGIWALIDSGFFNNAPRHISMLGIGFVVGYLSDRFLAKMKEITGVLFGSTEKHFKRIDRLHEGD